MTREEAKEFAPILHAYAEGKVIECRRDPSTLNGKDYMNGWTEMKEIEYWNNTEYRIKPEPTYRPFKNKEKCWQEMQKHQPFGWIKNKNTGYYVLVTRISNGNATSLNSIPGWSYKNIQEFYTFADGTPFGIRVEEQRMAWLAVDQDGSEAIYDEVPNRVHDCMWISIYDYVDLPLGSIKKLIGRELTWIDEPVELK